MVDDYETAVEAFLDFHFGSSVAGPVLTRWKLKGGVVELDGVVVGH